VGVFIALKTWPNPDPTKLWHRHDNLPADHPHILEGAAHVHDFQIDGLHTRWPETGAPVNAR
jgi:hypothetical protein